MKRLILLMLPLVVSCKILPDNLQPGGKDKEVLISQFERVGYSDFLISKDGSYHAVYQESPDFGKPVFIYYSQSTNGGKSWSAPVTISNDGTGNGSGNPRLAEDASGKVYAIWKRYGSSRKDSYPVSDVILDGTGGYEIGTLFYAILNGGTFSQPYMLANQELQQVSWFPALNPATGKIHVVWSQMSDESSKNGWNYWYYADIIREAQIDGSSASIVIDYTTAGKPEYNGGPPPQNGWQNLRGYFDNSGVIHLIGETQIEKLKSLIYFDGNTSRIVYQYPLYREGNTFNNPAELLRDESGKDHVVFLPSPSTLESEQVWDYNTSSNQTSVLMAIQKKGLEIQNFQADQGPGGEMAVFVQAGGLVDSNESFGLFYKNGKWTGNALTDNGSKESFKYAEFITFDGYRGAISSSTRYTTRFISAAWDSKGKKSYLTSLSADWSGLGFSTSNPSLYFVPLD